MYNLGKIKHLKCITKNVELMANLDRFEHFFSHKSIYSLKNLQVCDEENTFYAGMI